MKNLIALIAVFSGLILSSRAQTNIILLQTNWPTGGTNTLITNQFNLPVSSPWFTSSSTTAPLVGSNGLLVASTTALTSSGTWTTYFGSTNTFGATTNFATTNNPIVQLSPGRTIQLAMNFTTVGSDVENSSRHLRFLLGYSGTNQLSKPGTQQNPMTGYGQQMNFGQQFGVAPLETVALTNVTGSSVLSSSSTLTQIGANSGGTTNDPGFIDGTNYTLLFSVSEVSPTNIYITTTFIGANLNNGMITQTFTDTNYFDFTNYDTFVMRPNGSQGAFMQLQISSFSIMTFPIPSGSNVSTNSPVIAASLAAGNLTVSWPTNNIGWTLQTANNLLLPAWSDVTGSSTTNKVIIPVNPAATSVFYRLSLNP